jgi:hypothetical protein
LASGSVKRRCGPKTKITRLCPPPLNNVARCITDRHDKVERDGRCRTAFELCRRPSSAAAFIVASATLREMSLRQPRAREQVDGGVTGGKRSQGRRQSVCIPCVPLESACLLCRRQPSRQHCTLASS